MFIAEYVALTPGVGSGVAIKVGSGVGAADIGAGVTIEGAGLGSGVIRIGDGLGAGVAGCIIYDAKGKHGKKSLKIVYQWYSDGTEEQGAHIESR